MVFILSLCLVKTLANYILHSVAMPIKYSHSQLVQIATAIKYIEYINSHYKFQLYSLRFMNNICLCVLLI